ncbi:MAG: hypothetical protein AMR96_06335 [Candidatus Adiutrix intracellularis]|nr:MAG: hypothetical protein AMR96_06335 [Candidatus Adiutrix intracellularis]
MTGDEHGEAVPFKAAGDEFRWIPVAPGGKLIPSALSHWRFNCWEGAVIRLIQKSEDLPASCAGCFLPLKKGWKWRSLQMAPETPSVVYSLVREISLKVRERGSWIKPGVKTHGFRASLGKIVGFRADS